MEIDQPEKSEEVIEVSDALEQFSLEEPKKAELIKLRFFAGLPSRKRRHS